MSGRHLPKWEWLSLALVAVWLVVSPWRSSSIGIWRGAARPPATFGRVLLARLDVPALPLAVLPDPLPYGVSRQFPACSWGV